MYCSACGTQLAPGLSFCNRCGMSLKERAGSNAAPIAAFLSAITIIGIVGLGIMLGGMVTLNHAHLRDDLLGFFMLFTFLTVGTIEILLVRQLSRFTAASKTKTIEATPPLSKPVELRAPQTPRTLVESMPSVTESTTRTLQYSPNEPER